MSVRAPEKPIGDVPLKGKPVFPEPQGRTLRNGVRVVTLDLPWTHWVAIEVVARAGALYESAEIAGASHFLEHLRCRGCLSPEEGPLAVDERLDRMGAYLDAYTSPDHTAYLVQVRTENQADCLDILRCMVFFPDISPEQIEIERQVIQSEYASGNDDPEEVEYLARERILGAEGLGGSTIGTPESIRGLTVEALKAFDKRVYVPENTIVVVAGRLDPQALEKAWEGWESIPRGAGIPALASPQDGDRRERASFPGPGILFQHSRRASCDLVFAYPGFGEGDPNTVAASMLRHVLHKRISDRLRDARIPLYDLWFHMHSYEREGIFYAGARVTDRLVQTVELMNGELNRAGSQPPSGGEMVRMREWNRTYLVQLLDRPDEYAGRLAIEALYGTSLRPSEEWRITNEIGESDLQRVAQRLFHPEALTFCLLGGPGFREKRHIRRLLREAARTGELRKEVCGP